MLGYPTEMSTQRGGVADRSRYFRGPNPSWINLQLEPTGAGSHHHIEQVANAAGLPRGHIEHGASRKGFGARENEEVGVDDVADIEKIPFDAKVPNLQFGRRKPGFNPRNLRRETRQHETFVLAGACMVQRSNGYEARFGGKNILENCFSNGLGTRVDASRREGRRLRGRAI